MRPTVFAGGNFVGLKGAMRQKQIVRSRGLGTVGDYLIQALIEAIFTKTGRGLWGLVGLRPYDIVSMISGMIFWALVGLFAYAKMHG